MKKASSAYTIWVHMENEPGEYTISYKNVGKRVVKLAEHTLLEEIKLEGVENLHGRKDYRLTTKGLKQFIPYLLEYPEKTGYVMEYIDKFRLDRNEFLDLLYFRMVATMVLLSRYIKRDFWVKEDGIEKTPKEIMLETENKKLREEIGKINDHILKMSEINKEMNEIKKNMGLEVNEEVTKLEKELKLYSMKEDSEPDNMHQLERDLKTSPSKKRPNKSK